jgi:hypothetical protein
MARCGIASFVDPSKRVSLPAGIFFSYDSIKLACVWGLKYEVDGRGGKDGSNTVVSSEGAVDGLSDRRGVLLFVDGVDWDCADRSSNCVGEIVSCGDGDGGCKVF